MSTLTASKGIDSLIYLRDPDFSVGDFSSDGGSAGVGEAAAGLA
jgi:hypothetical protein